MRFIIRISQLREQRRERVSSETVSRRIGAYTERLVSSSQASVPFCFLSAFHDTATTNTGSLVARRYFHTAFILFLVLHVVSLAVTHSRIGLRVFTPLVPRALHRSLRGNDVYLCNYRLLPSPAVYKLSRWMRFAKTIRFSLLLVIARNSPRPLANWQSLDVA